jgi:hypothetical protein
MKTYGGVEVWIHLSSPRYYMEVIGQLHATAALPPGIGPPVPIGWEVGWVPESTWTLWRRDLSLPGIEPGPSSP